MVEEDKKEFSLKIIEMGSAFLRRIDENTIDSYFEHLKFYPLRLIKRAVDQAIQDKAEGNIFDIQQPPTVPEIIAQAEAIMEAEQPLKSICKECQDTGWLIEKRPEGVDGKGNPLVYEVAVPCRCRALPDAKSRGRKDFKKAAGGDGEAPF